MKWRTVFKIDVIDLVWWVVGTVALNWVTDLGLLVSLLVIVGSSTLLSVVAVAITRTVLNRRR